MTPLGTMMRLSGRASFKFRAESRASWLYLVACLFLRASALLGVFQLLFLCSLRNAGDAPLSVLSVSGEVAGALDAEPAATSLPHSAAAGEEHSAVSDAAGLVQSEGASGGHLRRSHRTDEQQAGVQAGLAPPGEPGLKQRRLSDRGGERQCPPAASRFGRGTILGICCVLHSSRGLLQVLGGGKTP